MIFKKDRIYLGVNIAVFTITGNRLKALLIKRSKEPFRGMRALPGGFVELDENPDETARRALMEETGIGGMFLKRLHAFGDIGRDPRARIVTLAYLALIPPQPLAFTSAKVERADWIEIEEATKLAFDHSKILDDALKHLRFEIQTTNIMFQLLPERFTLTELQRTYETILGLKLDKRNFRKKVAAMGLLKPLRQEKMEGAHRPAQLFTFKDREYTLLKEKVNILFPF